MSTHRQLVIDNRTGEIVSDINVTFNNHQVNHRVPTLIPAEILKRTTDRTAEWQAAKEDTLQVTKRGATLWLWIGWGLAALAWIPIVTGWIS